MQTRRQFVTRAGTAGAAAILTPNVLGSGLASARSAPLARGGSFAEGVISGDPRPNQMLLWTRLHDVGGRVSVDVEVARDADFRRVVSRKRVVTDASDGHAVKAQIRGLKAHEQYYYRFATRTKDSPVGRFRTALPADSNQPVRFAFYSCQDYTHGYYNALEAMAKEDLDFVVCLGDYIYAESYHSRADKTGVRDDRIGVASKDSSHIREAVSLSDYREKYALYRSDPAMRKLHRQFPLVVLWDDHEVQDNYAGGEADGGLGATKRYSNKRKAAGYRAFFESQPYTPPSSNRVYRTINYGRTVELFVMDQRQYRKDQPCDDAVAVACADYDQPRDFLGRRQMNWLKAKLSASQASWKVMANELTMMPTKVLGDSFFMFDGWQGYPREREELLTHIRDGGIKDVVFVTGDIHTFISGDVRTQLGAGQSVALEFVGGSITSQGLGELDIDAGGGAIIKGNDANPKTDPALIAALRGINPWVDQADLDHHGYGKVVATPDGLDCELVRMQTIKRRTTAKLPSTGYRYKVARGQTSILGKSS